MTSLKLEPHSADLHVGARLRFRRKMMNLSQTDLAEALGITFQQIQKYERGANRISASKIYEAACFLGVTVTFFFEGLGDPQIIAPANEVMQKLTMLPDGVELANKWPKIPAKIRHGLMAVIRSLQPEREGDIDNIADDMIVSH